MFDASLAKRCAMVQVSREMLCEKADWLEK
jgi:hypothetical protein